MGDIELYRGLDLSNPDENTLVNPRDQFSNNEYITYYREVIVYRNVYNTDVYKVIDKLVCESGKILMVRQFNNDLQLLWAGTMPMQYVVKRSRQPKISTKDNTYTIIASITISK